MNDDTISQIERLHALKQRGAITDAEFEVKKFALLHDSVKPSAPPDTVTMVGTDWRAVVSMIIGILCALAGTALKTADRDAINGVATFAVVGLVLGILALAHKPHRGRAMAITGVTLTSIALLFVLAALPD